VKTPGPTSCIEPDNVIYYHHNNNQCLGGLLTTGRANREQTQVERSTIFSPRSTPLGWSTVWRTAKQHLATIFRAQIDQAFSRSLQLLPLLPRPFCSSNACVQPDHLHARSVSLPPFPNRTCPPVWDHQCYRKYLRCAVPFPRSHRSI